MRRLENYTGQDFGSHIRTGIPARFLVHVLHKVSNSCPSRATTAEKVQKKRNPRAELLFCLINLLLFAVRVAAAVVGAKAA